MNTSWPLLQKSCGQQRVYSYSSSSSFSDLKLSINYSEQLCFKFSETRSPKLQMKMKSSIKSNHLFILRDSFNDIRLFVLLFRFSESELLYDEVDENEEPEEEDEDNDLADDAYDNEGFYDEDEEEEEEEKEKEQVGGGEEDKDTIEDDIKENDDEDDAYENGLA